MALTKTRTSIWSGVTLAVGTPQTSSVINLTGSYGATISIKITNGATGPTLPAQVQVKTANDTVPTLLADYCGVLVGPTSNSGTSSWVIEIPIGVEAVELVGSGNTGQSVTLDADISIVTAV